MALRHARTARKLHDVTHYWAALRPRQRASQPWLPRLSDSACWANGYSHDGRLST